MFKKKSRKLERKEKALFIFGFIIYIIAILAIETAKDPDLVTDKVLYIAYIACASFLMSGLFITIKYYKKKMLVILGISLILKAVLAFSNLLR